MVNVYFQLVLFFTILPLLLFHNIFLCKAYYVIYFRKKRFHITVIVHFVLWTGLALFICKWYYFNRQTWFDLWHNADTD